MKAKNNKGKKTHKIRRFFIIFGLTFLGLVMVGLTYEKISEFIDLTTLNIPGQFITVNGYKMHIYCTGNNINEPTVILDSGSGGNWEDWQKVQPEISKHTKVCSYDRSGLGFSEVNPNVHNNADAARNLQDLLKVADIKPPYVLVGHSLAGFNIRIFANNHKKDIAGLVFVDSQHENLQNIKMGLSDKLMNFGFDFLYKFASQTGLMRIILTLDPNMNIITPVDRTIARAGTVTPKAIYTGSDEINENNISYDEVLKAKNFVNIPIIVLTAQQDYEEFPIWLSWQKELATMSTNSKQISVKDTGHYIHIDQPQIVIDNILSLLK
ncbi:MAG: alpha/beta hydrolase [Candidatus Saccharibacteria bacterium]